MIQENQRLIYAGASLLPLAPRSKRPVDREWSTLPRQGLVILKKRFKVADYNIGIRLGEPSKLPRGFLMAVDMDIHDELGVTEAWEAVERILGKIVHKLPRQKSGSAGASVHLFFVCEESFSGRKVATSNRIIKRANGKTGPAWEVEIFGTGKQVATAPSIHPDTGKPYRWIKPLDPHTIPLIDAEVIASIVYSEDEGHLDDEALGLSYDEVRDFISRLPAWKASDRKDWIDVAMGIKHELGPDGLPIFVEFSKRDLAAYNRVDKETGKPGRVVVREQYKSIKNSVRHGKLITMRTIIAAVREHEHEESMRTAADEFDDIEDEGPTRAELLADFPDIDEPGEPGEPEKPKKRAGDPDMTILGAASTEAPEYDWSALLGDEIASMLRDLSVALKCPLDYCVGAYLWAVSALAGNAVVVRNGKVFEQPSVFFGLLIGGPSTGKTAPLEFFRKIVNSIEAEHRGVWKIAHERWKDDAEIATEIEKEWKAVAKQARKKGEEAPPKPAGATPPPEPAEPLVYVTDFTPESLGNHHIHNPRGVSIHTQEINNFFQRMMNGYTGINDRGTYLQAYDASPARISRMSRNGGGKMDVPRFAVSIVGGIQPDILLSIGGKSLADDGLVARFMPFWPKKTPRDFMSNAPTHAVRFSYMLSAIYDDLLMIKTPGAPAGVMPNVVEMDADAARRFQRWAHEREVREKAAMPRLEGVLGKGGGLIARMALWARIGRWANDPSEDEIGTITLAEMEEAIRWREVYAKPQQLRVFQFTMETEERKQARKVAEWIVANPDEKTINSSKLRRDAGIEGFTGATRAQEMDDVIQYLIHLRWLYPIEDRKPQGGRPSKSYGVNERVHELLD